MNIKRSFRQSAYVEARPVLEKMAGQLTLGGLLESIRLGEGMNQARFAKRLRVSKSHMCDIEKGRKNVSPARAAQFAKQLGYSQEQFVRLSLQDIVKRDGLSYKVSVEVA
jgi:transcriptional regulator with XRE-family HTH domain